MSQHITMPVLPLRSIPPTTSVAPSLIEDIDGNAHNYVARVVDAWSFYDNVPFEIRSLILQAYAKLYSVQFLNFLTNRYRIMNSGAITPALLLVSKQTLIEAKNAFLTASTFCTYQTHLISDLGPGHSFSTYLGFSNLLVRVKYLKVEWDGRSMDDAIDTMRGLKRALGLASRLRYLELTCHELIRSPDENEVTNTALRMLILYGIATANVFSFLMPLRATHWPIWRRNHEKCQVVIHSDWNIKIQNCRLSDAEYVIRRLTRLGDRQLKGATYTIFSARDPGRIIKIFRDGEELSIGELWHLRLMG